MAQQTKIELLLELKNRISTGLTNASSQIDTQVGRMQNKLKQFGSEIPLVGQSLAMLTNPIGLTVAGVGLLATGFVKATDRAQEFNTHFRNLSNLNLTKTKTEIEDLRKLVLDTAWKKKFGAEETSTAYNDIQSTIGLYGKDARVIVEKQGEFAKVMKANMNDYVAGTAKAMANWRFGTDRLDDFNKSAYAAMQVGVVSFEQLSSVQSVYSGASAAIKQDFDTANKLFALFTIKTKSVDEAATLTKSLMNDLTKKTTIDAFKKIGINFYDAGGQLKQVDKIMLELNAKFMQLKSDKSIIALKNQFAGSEGLIAMIQAATDRSGELKKTFDEFANSKLNMSSALEQAQADIVYRQEQLANRIDNLIIRMGQIMLPVKEWAVGVAERFVDGTKSYFSTPEEHKASMQDIASRSVLDKYGSLISSAKNMSEEQYQSYITALSFDIANHKNEFDKKTDEYISGEFWKYDPITYFKGDNAKLDYADENAGYSRHYNLGYSKALKTLMNDFIHARTSSATEETKGLNAPPDKTDSSKLEESLNKVVGSAQAPKNIYINIDAFNKGGINTQNTSLQKMDESQIEDWFNDMCMRAVRNVELSYH